MKSTVIQAAVCVLIFVAGRPARGGARWLPLHREWNAVPAPAKVAIDGNLSDWDTSAGIYIHGGMGATFTGRAVWAYHFNRKTAMAADLASKAMLQPAEWDDLAFEAQE